MKSEPIGSVNEYIATFPKEVQERLKQMRILVQTLAPNAIESISYGMPAYKLYGKPLVYFAAAKHHIGFYATPTGHEEFKKELSKFKTGKGSVQFPNDLPLPVGLISRIIEFRVQENEEKYGKR